MKDTQTQSNTIKEVHIDTKKFIHKLARPIGKSIYYNKNYWTEICGCEMRPLGILLSYLYKKRKEKEIQKDSKYLGISKMEIIEECGICEHTLNKLLAWLFPVVDLRGQKFGDSKNVSRFYWLNDNGVILCEKLIENKKRYQEQKKDKEKLKIQELKLKKDKIATKIQELESKTQDAIP